MATVVHLAAHPDDELLGAPATLFALRDAGHKVVNFACGLGRPSQRRRREAELVEACRRARFELWISDPPVELTAADDLQGAQAELTETFAELLAVEAPEIVVSPSPHDGHHAHEVVARAARAALERLGDDAPRWWLWGLWSDVQIPSLLTSFDTPRLEEMLAALEAYEGELRRNDYRVLLEARSEMTAIVGAERIFGFGSRRLDAPYAELLAELVRHDGAWRLGRPRRLDPVRPFAPPWPAKLDWWLDRESVSDHLRRDGISPEPPPPR